MMIAGLFFWRALLKRIHAEDLVCMDDLPEWSGIAVDLAYARADNLLFGEAIYRADAKLHLHYILAEIVMRAGALARERHGMSLVLYDGLRTIEAQGRMLETRRVRENPHWVGREPRLLSPPGAGGHPRGMAIDLTVAGVDGRVLAMGTPFDFLAEDSGPANNPAHREHPQNERVARNRAILDSVMADGAQATGHPLFPLPQEWWDYRLPRGFYEEYAPLSELDLPEPLRLMG